MKKVFLILIIFLFSLSHSAFALDWAYPFVVWKGNLYEVTDIEVESIGKQIGKVKRETNDMTGEYWGDASNAFPRGTKYYEINGVSTKDALAVEVKSDKWVRANYIGESHGTFSLTPNGFILLLIILMLAVVMVIVFVRRKHE